MMRLSYCAALIFLAIPILGWGIPSQPFVRPPEPNPSKALVRKIEESHPVTAEEWYERALLHIQNGDRPDARESLQRALELDPHFLNAWVQLGFLQFWEGDLCGACFSFERAQEESPCEPNSRAGLEEIALIWSRSEETQCDALFLYQELNACTPNNPDLLYHVGQLQARTGQWEEAERTLQECLHLSPQYTDAALQLGTLYVWEKRWDDAESIFSQYPDNKGAQEGLGKVAAGRGDLERAEGIYRQILQQDPQNTDVRRRLAEVLTSQLKFKKAKRQYRTLMREDPDNQIFQIRSMDVKSHTNVALFYESSYTQAKENDPSLGVPVVKDYYFYSSLKVLVPIFDQWRLDAKQVLNKQRENDIFPPVGVNYNVYVNAGQLNSYYFFVPNWRWEVVLRGLAATGDQNVNYPFKGTARFEPGTSITFNDGQIFSTLDAHVESFIIKNFSIFRSELLRIDVLDGVLGFRPDVWLRPEVEGSAAVIWFHDNLHNIENIQNLWAKCDLFFLSPYVRAIYRFEHGGFQQLNQNYYSFKRQIRHTIGALLHVDVFDRAYVEGLFEHRWQSTRDLFQPIGNFVFVAAHQYLVANRVTGRLGYRFRDELRIELEGHYFRDTLPYRDYNVKGSILWQF